MLQRKWEHVVNQSLDFVHKLSNRLVKLGYTSLAVENLHIQNMVKNHNLAQSIQNASWNKFMQMLSYKAESANIKIIKVDARNTSKECSNCGNIYEMPLSERMYLCNRCGLQIDRDINASINILHRATTLGQRGSYAQRECKTSKGGSSRGTENRQNTSFEGYGNRMTQRKPTPFTGGRMSHLRLILFSSESFCFNKYYTL